MPDFETGLLTFGNERKKSAFTFVEVSIVISIIAIICMIAVPSAIGYVKKSKDAVLKKDLYVMRECIDKFHAAFNRYPVSLDELVEKSLLRAIPVDPITGDASSWKTFPSKDDERDVYNVKSGAPGLDYEGKAYEGY